MTNMRRPTVLLADDHVVFIDGIVRILRDRFDVVGTVNDGSTLLKPPRVCARMSLSATSRCRC